MRAKIFTLHVLLLLAGCSSVPSLLYKIDIQQGNVITHEMLGKIKPGMTRAQVRFVLGSPVISDAFHGNRWDYVYRLEQEGRLIEQHRITAFFEDDRLTHTEGRLRPSLTTNSFKAAVAKPIEERPKPVAAPRPARAAPKKIAPPSVPVDPMEVDQPKEERDLFGAREGDQPKEKKGMIDMMLGK